MLNQPSSVGRIGGVGTIYLLISFIIYYDAKIDPGNAFRLVVKVAKFVADGEYGLVEMAEQQHDLWLDRNCQYSMAQFQEDLATKII